MSHTVTFAFANGDKVRDIVTGLEGIVISRTEWLNKCIRYAVQPPEVKDGKPAESHWVDQEQLELVQAAAVKIKKETVTGGPKDGEASMMRKDDRR